MPRALSVLSLSTLVLAGCENLTPTTPSGARGALPGASASRGVAIGATGGGHYLLQNVADTRFSFSAVQRDDGTAAGQFRMWVDLGDGTADITGEVTCLATNPALGRAWIGGIVKHNTSTSPQVMTAIHQPGRDVWFRVLDAGEGGGAVDRTSFVGFEGAAGIITSEAYCAAMIWPDDNARTWPVTSGNIQVRR